jgi:hypothetical protein
MTVRPAFVVLEVYEVKVSWMSDCRLAFSGGHARAFWPAQPVLIALERSNNGFKFDTPA